jgi:hypothetical protein
MKKKFSEYLAEAVTTVEGAKVSQDVLLNIAYRLVQEENEKNSLLEKQKYEFKIKSLRAYYSQKLSFLSQRSVIIHFELE